MIYLALLHAAFLLSLRAYMITREKNRAEQKELEELS